MFLVVLFLSLLVYVTIGRTIINIGAAIKEINLKVEFDEEDIIFYTLLWPIFVIVEICKLLWKLISFIANKISIIPITIIKIITTKVNKYSAA